MGLQILINGSIICSHYLHNYVKQSITIYRINLKGLTSDSQKTTSAKYINKTARSRNKNIAHDITVIQFLAQRIMHIFGKYTFCFQSTSNMDI